MERRAIAVHGVVQGVGFRPFVYGLASRLGLRGFVKNQTGGVLIEVEGEARSLDRFLAELAASPPPAGADRSPVLGAAAAQGRGHISHRAQRGRHGGAHLRLARRGHL